MTVGYLHRSLRLTASPRAALGALLLALAACGAPRTAETTGGVAGRPASRTTAAAGSAPAAPTRPPATLRALVTDESENLLLVVDLSSGRVVRRVPVPADPENVVVGDGVVVVVSSRSARVTLLDRRSLRVLRVLGGFGSPHIPAISRDGEYAYVTDDARGTLSAIRLPTLSVTSTIAVGAGAHHIAFSPDGRQAWIALGESAGTIAIVDCTHPARPRLAGRFEPGFAAHDLAFSPNGGQVWISSAHGPDVVAFAPRDHRLLFRVPVGAGPQHLVFAGRYAYLTSGYGSTIERVLASNGRVLARVPAPYGSFELDAGHGMVAASSLLRGTLAVFDSGLRPLRTVAIAPAARDVEISVGSPDRAA